MNVDEVRAGRSGLGVLLGTILLLAFTSGATAGPAAAATGGGFDRADLAALDQAARNDRDSVELLIAAEEGRADVVAAGIRSLGGTVAVRRDGIGYVRARVPVARARQASLLESVEAVDVARVIPLDDPAPQSGEPGQPQIPPTSLTPRSNPYMPLRDTGADLFGAVPVRDGRGVKVAILDSGVDLAHEALQTTTTGAPKVIDWVNELPPPLDATWVKTTGTYAGQFSAAGLTWTAPGGPARFAFGTLIEDRDDLYFGPLEGDLNRNGIRGETIGVIQDRTTREVIVDANMNRDFTDDLVLLDYSVHHQHGFLGEDDPGSEVEDRVAFTVDTRKSEYGPSSYEGSWVNIGIAGHPHGTHVAGIAAANGMFGGAMSGAAPGAQLISIKVCPSVGGCATPAMTEGMLYAAQHGADVANMSIGMANPFNDGRDAEAEIYNRIVDEYGMAIFIAAGNEGPGVKTVTSPSVASGVISVAAGPHRDTGRATYGQAVDREYSLATFSSRGPTLDGSLKPEITAPGAAVSAIPPWLPGEAVDGIYPLPPGYAMQNGTSMAAPQAAGAAALLVGAFRDAYGESPGATRIRRAMLTGAKLIPGAAVNGQGAGLIDTPEAWNLLEQMRSGTPPPAIEVETAVNSLLADYLTVPGRGQGIVEREGIDPGGRLTRTLTLTRTSGPPGSQSFALTVQGDVAISVPASVSLPLGVPIPLVAEINTGDPGIRSGLIRIDDAGTVGVDRLIPVTVMTSKPAAPQIAYSGTVRKGGDRGLTFRVPPRTAAFRVTLDGGGPAPGDGQLRFRMVNPMGMVHDEFDSRECFIPDTGAGCRAGSPVTRTVTDPTPGVWEVDVEAFRGSSSQAAPYTVTGSLTRAAISPDQDRIAYRKTGRINRTYEISNPGIPFTGRLVGGTLAVSRGERVAIKAEGLIQRSIEVPDGTDQLVASIGAPSNPASLISLYLYDCRQMPCTRVADSEAWDGSGSVALEKPPEGPYLVRLMANKITGDSSEFDLRMAIHHPDYGSITTSDADAGRASGSNWTAGATVSVDRLPEPGWDLGGNLRVMDADGAVIARSRIDLVRETCPATRLRIGLVRVRSRSRSGAGRGPVRIGVRMQAGRRVIARISPRVRYRVRGRVRAVKLRRQTVQISGSREFRFAVPRRMARDYRRTRKRLRGSRVTFVLQAKARPHGTAPSCDRRVRRGRLRVRVN